MADDTENLLDYLGTILRTGDPVRARAAYDVGEAAAYGWEDLPHPHDSVIETTIDGLPVRVLLLDSPPDDSG